MSELASRHCVPAHGPALSNEASRSLLAQLKGWILDEDPRQIHRTFSFGNYYETMAFVNAVAWIAHREDHHPDLAVGYNKVTVTYSTHSVSGLSENDFICAARIDMLEDR